MLHYRVPSVKAKGKNLNQKNVKAKLRHSYDYFQPDFFKMLSVPVLTKSYLILGILKC